MENIQRIFQLGRKIIPMCKVRDLKDQTFNSRNNTILLCGECGGEYSANAADYSWQLKPEHVLKCCGEPLVQVIKRTVYDPV